MNGHRNLGFRYAAQAIDRVRQKNPEFTREFINSVSQKEVARAVKILPNPPGFRPNSVQGVRRKVHLLTNRLAGNKPRGIKNTQRDYNALGYVWMVWGTEHLGDASVINEYIQRRQELGQDEVNDDEKNMEDEESIALELFEKLRDLSHLDKCTREDIKKFFDFSPFVDTQRLQEVIESSKSSEDVKYGRSIAELPGRVEKAESDISELHGNLDTLSKNKEVIEGKLTDLDAKIENLEHAVSRGNKIVSRALSSLKSVQADMASNQDRVVELSEFQEKQEEYLAKTVGKLQRDLTELQDLIKPLFNSSETLENTVSSLRLELDQMRELVSKFQLIVNPVSDSKNPSEDVTKPGAGEASASYSILLERIKNGNHTEKPETLHQIDDIVAAVAKNLESLNVFKSSAEALARECVASLAAGQIPYFSGINGKGIAKACAMALAAHESYVLTVPVGVLSPYEFCRKLSSLATNDSEFIGCVIIDGINRSALDTFGECLIEQVNRRRFGDRTSRPMLIMATLTDGPASLAPSLTHVSLGPVFYTDSLEWHSRSNSESQMSYCRTLLETWQQICSQVERTVPDTEEALQILSDFVPVANPLLKGTVITGLRSLSALHANSSGPTELQSLVFGWLAPICIIAGANLEAVDQHFNNGLVDGSAPDKRIRNLLLSGTFDNAEIPEI